MMKKQKQSYAQKQCVLFTNKQAARIWDQSGLIYTNVRERRTEVLKPADAESAVLSKDGVYGCTRSIR